MLRSTLLSIALVLSAVLSIGARDARAGEAASRQNVALTETRKLLELMDRDGNGRVSKQEFLDFMAAEFDRLDVNKDGSLDLKELEKLRVKPVSNGPHR